MNTRQGCQTATRDRDDDRRPASRWGRGDEIAGLNGTLDGVTLLPEISKPFDALAERLISENTGGGAI